MKPPYTDTKSPGSPVETPYKSTDARRLSFVSSAPVKAPVASEGEVVVLCEPDLPSEGSPKDE